MRAALAVSVLIAVAVAGCGGGSTESIRPGPPDSISFWDADHGIAGAGQQTGHGCSGTISLTTDGGRNFREVLRIAFPVEWVDTAGSMDAGASPRGCGHRELLHPSDGGRTWSPLPHSNAADPSFGDSRHGVAITSDRFASFDRR